MMISSADGDARREQRPAPKQSSHRPAVLLVDDIEENLFALVALLGRDDVDLLTARSGREALEVLLHRTIALAIIDVHMPEIDGFDLAALMRGVEKTRHVPIIFVTAASPDDRRVFAGYEAGAVDFLFKPVDPHVLRSKVDVFVTLETQRQELHKSEARFRALVETTSQAVWRTDPHGSPIVDSPSFREFTGIDELAWLDGRWLEMVHPDDAARVDTAWRRALAAREPAEFEYRVRRHEGHYTWTLARVAPVFDDQGQLVEWIGANTDIQARKETEIVREMFVAILSHDLRNPVAAIQMWAQLVLSRTNPVEHEAIRRPTDRVISVASRMVRMIEQLLDLTRVRLGGGIEPSPTASDMEAIVGQGLAEVVNGRERFRVETAGDMTGTWDVDRIYQVISNLVRNALEHSPADTPICVRLDGTHAAAFQLRVHNLGPPIPTSLRDEIFEPFRGSNNLKRRSRGLGLGLFITKQIVQAHGGTISLETGDAGTTFSVDLPRHTIRNESAED
jgi:PAS domain S-box-containing protein